MHDMFMSVLTTGCFDTPHTMTCMARGLSNDAVRFVVVWVSLGSFLRLLLLLLKVLV